MVQVRIYPWQTTPASGQLRFCRTIEVHVSFSQPAATETGAAPTESDFDALLADQVLNWPVARAWATAAPPESAAPPPALPWQTGVRITVAAAGLHHVCLLYTSPSPRDRTRSRMPSSALKKKTNHNQPPHKSKTQCR